MIPHENQQEGSLEHDEGNLFLDIMSKVRDKVQDEERERLAPVVALMVEAHEGVNGPDGKPLALHSLDVMSSSLLITPEQRQLGILHDAATPGYTNFSEEDFVKKAREAGCSEKVIAAAMCFARPTEEEGWRYDDWISFLMRDDLTRLVKAADSEAALKHFPPASENQRNAWLRTRDRLLANESEPSEVTARIEQSMHVHPLPNLNQIPSNEAAA